MELQSNYTNEAQSKALIAAGVPAETADCSLEKIEPSGKIIIRVTNYGEDYQFFIDDGVMPCWSLGRLIEMATFLVETMNRVQQPLQPLYMKVFHSDEMVEDMVAWFERFAKMHDNAFKPLLPDKPQPKPEAKRVENCAIRYFGSWCPLQKNYQVDIYNCTNCEHYFATASKSIICKHVENIDPPTFEESQGEKKMED